jgi:hypothetical protein
MLIGLENVAHLLNGSSLSGVFVGVFVVDYTPPKTPNIVEPDHQNCIVYLMPSVSGGHKFFFR